MASMMSAPARSSSSVIVRATASASPPAEPRDPIPGLDSHTGQLIEHLCLIFQADDGVSQNLSAV